jgi:YVTN family beta-propeller protein
MRVQQVLFLVVVALVSACSGPEQPSPNSGRAPAPAPTTAPVPPPVAGRVFVTNENGGDISVVDVATQKVVATIPVGKRPRGIRLSRDGSHVFVALSGSPIAPPGNDEIPSSSR